MAAIFPFHALRYNPAKTPLAEVVTQPYDKISPEMQERYYQASPYNLVRVILGKPAPGDSEQESVYTRAAASLREWRAENVLVRDPQPSIYVYTQTFRQPGDGGTETMERRGFIALGQLEDYDSKVIFRHEQTLSKPKADRLNLLQATQAHCGQLFMLYSDPAMEIDRALQQTGPPTSEVRDEYGVLHRLWRMSEPGLVQQIQTRMADKKLIIADGHHRYETALNYRNAMRGKYGIAPGAPYDRVMMTFVNMDSPGLVVMPTHRVVFGLNNFAVDDVVAKLRVKFDVEDLGAVLSAADAVRYLHDRSKDNPVSLAVTAQRTFLLRLRSASTKLSRLSERQRQLNVVQLHKLVLEEALGMSEEDIRDQKHLRYLRSANEAVEEVRQGANVAFLLNPVSVEQMRDIAFAGEVLPQKSTDFYPKLLSGLTIYWLEEAAELTASGGH